MEQWLQVQMVQDLLGRSNGLRPFCCVGQDYPYPASEHPTERQAEEWRGQTLMEAQCSPISFKILATHPN